MLGGMAGALLVWLAYRQHFAKEADADLKLAVFCTAPAIRSVTHNVLTEAICTFVLILGVLYLASPQVGLGALDALPVGLLVLGIGISLGGPTGYAMAARDLSPRIMHALLPIPGKRDSDWRYAWVPVVGPLLGAARPACTCTCTRRSDRRLKRAAIFAARFTAPRASPLRFRYRSPSAETSDFSFTPYPRQPTTTSIPRSTSILATRMSPANPDARPKPLAATSRAPASK